jgi:hypothetical protein
MHRSSLLLAGEGQEQWCCCVEIYLHIQCLCMQTLLPRIVQLWEDLQVPLVHRSRFYLAFKGRETFYYEAEHRRLIHQQTQVQSPCSVFKSS